MKQNKVSQSTTALLEGQDEAREPGGLLSRWRRSSNGMPVAPSRPVKFFADWPAAADHKEPKTPTR